MSTRNGGSEPCPAPPPAASVLSSSPEKQSVGGTISDRAMSGLSRSLRFAGQIISKERYAKGVKSGVYTYHPKTIRRLKLLEFRRAVIDQYAPQMKPRERQLIYEWMRRRESGVMHPASEEEGLNRRFKKLFEKYEANGDADALREMLGSEVRDTGAFSIAA
jgi:hypothetical protein